MMAATPRIAAFLLAGALALAEEGWARLDRLAPGREVTIHLRSKEKARGSYVSHAADSITISREDGSKLTAAKNDVARLVARRRVAGKAAAAGAVAGALPMVILTSGAEDFSAAGVLLYGGIGAGIGALSGWLIGRAAGSETVYDSRR